MEQYHYPLLEIEGNTTILVPADIHAIVEVRYRNPFSYPVQRDSLRPQVQLEGHNVHLEFAHIVREDVQGFEKISLSLHQAK
ncbi:MAG: hypothetical protein RBT80_24305 [Candidatus Vecturithrix sp.]|nr:hypothetical protein [Candidatus Vecturithrix sp.]